MKTETVKIDGMTCQNCVNHVTKALKSLEPVAEVSVSLETGEAVVSYDASDSILGDIKDAVTGAGYRVVE